MTGQKVLVVDDETDFANGLARLISSDFPELAVSVAYSSPEALRAMDTSAPDLLLLDLNMPGMHGFDVMHAALEKHPNLSVVVLTAYGTVETAVAALKKGAWDFLTKPVGNEELQRAVAKGCERSFLLGENSRLKLLAARSGSGNALIGDSEVMRRLRETIAAVAAAEYTVFIHGESGTGKELVAESIHRLSSRKDRPFIRVNCPAIPESLLESELFGHVKGAFTGATANHKGLFAEAAGGTLMLDEIGDIPPAVQTKLLRVLQDGVIRPVGAGKSMRADARIIAVTNQNLEAKIKDGTFREDLFYRLNVLGVQTPALREHKEDIPLLAAYFLAQACSEMGVEPKHLSPEATAGLSLREWPGNIRELQNFMRRMAVFADGPEVKPHHLRTGAGRRSSTAPASPYKEAKLELVENFTRQYLSDLLRSTGGNISETARISGLGRVSLQKILRRIDLDADVFRRG